MFHKRHWIVMGKPKASTPINSIAGGCIAARVRRLNRVVTNVYDDALRPLKLKVSPLDILTEAASMGIAEPARVCVAL
jgi:hypothetical protein